MKFRLLPFIIPCYKWGFYVQEEGINTSYLLPVSRLQHKLTTNHKYGVIAGRGGSWVGKTIVLRWPLYECVSYVRAGRIFAKWSHLHFNCYWWLCTRAPLRPTHPAAPANEHDKFASTRIWSRKLCSYLLGFVDIISTQRFEGILPIMLRSWMFASDTIWYTQTEL